ncbi:MAG: S9 family peptidase [Deltaproteobacteria bacterium]|nr:S9 family peptidase [Deltaproteobacteria bacterium]
MKKLNLLAALLFLSSCTSQKTAPITPQTPQVVEVNNIKLIDNYAWLNQTSDPKVLKHYRNEERYTETAFKQNQSINRELFREMQERELVTPDANPIEIDGYRYFSKQEKGFRFPVYYRAAINSANEDVILDLNSIAIEYPQATLGTLRISPDSSKILFSLRETPARGYALFLRTINNDSMKKISDSVHEFEFSQDGSHAYFTTLDSLERPYRLYLSDLSQEAEELVYEEDEDALFLRLSRSKSGAHIFLASESINNRAVRIIDTTKQKPEVKLLRKVAEDQKDYIYEGRGSFYILTNNASDAYKVYRTPVSAIAKGNWALELAPPSNGTIEKIDVFKNYLVALTREEGLPVILVKNLTTGLFKKVSFDENFYEITFGANPAFSTEKFNFSYSSPITPKITYEYDMKNLQLKERNRELVEEHNPNEYESLRTYATSADGTKVPMTLIVKKERPNAPLPTILHAYGSYGLVLDASFESERLPLLERDFVYAFCHVRGGGFLGPKWHKAGQKLNKQNSHKDFIACAKHLVKKNITTPKQLSAYGRSAGGALVAAALNAEPNLFAAAILDYPFLDVLGTLLNPSLPLTKRDYEEWGNPKNPEILNYLSQYAPYVVEVPKTNTKSLVTVGLLDKYVGPWEGAKWVAKQRELNSLAYLRVLENAGHEGALSSERQRSELAFQYGFLLNELEAKPSS